jgi:hypothetical protein
MFWTANGAQSKSRKPLILVIIYYFQNLLELIDGVRVSDLVQHECEVN